MSIKSFHRFGLTLLLVLAISITHQVLGQSIDPNDLSQVRVDELTDAQIRTYMIQAESLGMSDEELEQMALQRGMPLSEVQKLRARVDLLRGAQGEGQQATAAPRAAERQVATDEQEVPDTLEAEEPSGQKPRYGQSLFQTASATFEPNLRLATPANYLLGPADEILIDVVGQSEAKHTLNVSPEGTINIPHVGIVHVGGLTIEEATQVIRSRMSSVYSAIRTGGTRVVVALGNIRSIKVVVTGDVAKPGTYTLPSVASAFNALYHAGGPNEHGSLRDIRVIRNGEVIATLDVYEVMANGVFSENPILQDQDVIMVPRYLKHVELEGEVVRPYRFELKAGETFADLLRYAGGFADAAYRARVKVIRFTDREKRVEDVLDSQFDTFEPVSGDQYLVEKVLDRYVNRVVIHGAVFRPGEYELTPGLTLSMLIKKAEGLKEDAFLKRGTIARLKDDLQPERLSFDVAAVLAGVEPDIELRREDVVNIHSIFELQEAYSVEITGEVRQGGRFPYAEGMTLQDLILQAGGFSESASQARIEVSRRVRNADVLSESAQIAEIFQVDLAQGLGKEDQDFVLQPFDEVAVRTASGYETQKSVRIEGEVLYPGVYTIASKDERISDLIKRAGGFTPFAYVNGASLRRKGSGATRSAAESAAEQTQRELEQEDEYNRLMLLQSLQTGVNRVDGVDIAKNLNNEFVGIDLERIIRKPGQRGDLILEDGDVIRVPKELQTVKISGEVLAPSIAVYGPNKGFKQYVSQAGGFSQRALRKSAYVLYANGSVKSTTRFLFFNSYPPIKPGAEIFVPQKIERPPMSAQQWVGLGTGVASMAAIILAIFK